MKENVRSPRSALRQTVFNAVFAALLCVLAPLAVPIGPVPITLGLFVVFATGVVLSPWNSVQAIAVYLVLGAFGLPVFSNGAGGIQVLFGPTGGYLWSYILVSPAIGLIRAACPQRICAGTSRATRVLGAVWEVGACVVGMLICYIGGTAQFCAVTGNGLAPALATCVWPFVPFDLFKCVMAVAIGRRMRKLR